MAEGLGRQRPAETARRLAVVGIEFGQQRRIVAGIDDDADAIVVLCGRTDHRGAADIDVLDDLIKFRTARQCLAEGIEIADQKVDRRQCRGQATLPRARGCRASPEAHRAPSGAASSRGHPSSRESR